VQQNINHPITNSFKPDYLYWVKHYCGLFWRWKWYIIFTFPILVATFLLLTLKFGKIQPELNVGVLLGIENPSTVLVLPDASPNGLGKMKLIQSRSFLREVVDTLSLNFILPRNNRSQILTYLDIDSSAIIGKYHFQIEEGAYRYTIYVSNRRLGLDKKAVTSGVLPSLDTLRSTGMTIVFSQDFLKKPFSFDFFVISMQDAVEDLKNRVVIQGNPKRDPMQDGVVGVFLSGKDPELICSTVNMIADLYVQKNLSFRKRKTTEIMRALQKQMQVAQEQLAGDENRVRQFKEANPKIGLGTDAQTAISNIASLESRNFDITNESQEANDLYNRLSSSEGNSEQVTSEALLFLGSRKIPGAIVLQQDYNMLLQQKFSLSASMYSPSHPLVKEVQSKIDSIHVKTVSLMNDFIRKQQDNIAQTNTQKSQAMNQLQGMPKKEMQLAALIRQQQINSEIYSNILSRYNQAKIADETEVPDIYVMDHAVPPEPAAAKKELMKLLAIGLLICMGISFGPPVAVNFFDKRPRSEDDLKRFMPYVLLESIPVIKTKKSAKRQKQEDNNLGVDPKLIAFGPNVTYVHELFRSLRAKINYRLESREGRSLLITSSEAGEGKSFIASNVAIMASQQHAPTLLIDGDIRRGVLHESFAIPQQPGLTELLLSKVPLNEQILRNAVKRTSYAGLFVLSSGVNLQNSTELLTTSRFQFIIKWALTRFSMVIIDSPPIIPVTDAVILSNLVSGCIMVVKAGRTNTAELNRRIHEFPTLQSKVIGVVLNGVNDDQRRKKYNTYYYRENSKGSKQLLLTSKLEDGSSPSETTEPEVVSS